MVKRTGSVQIAFMVPIELADRMKELSRRTRVPQAAYFREGLEEVLKRHDTSAKAGRKSKRSSE